MCPALRHSRPPVDTDRAGRLVLDDRSVHARAQPCPGMPSMAQVVVLDGTAVPSTEQWRRWSGILATAGFTSMRTGALSPRQADQAGRAGLQCVQELVLLDMVVTDPGPLGAGSALRTRRMRSSQLAELAAIDLAAFGSQWCLDADMLAEVRRATPSHRSRVVRHADAPGLAGFVISGLADRTGYIQRLAVRPELHRRGLGAALLIDALTWMHRSRLRRVYVNTHVENHAALELYLKHGFAVVPDRLRVLEGPTSS